MGKETLARSTNTAREVNVRSHHILVKTGWARRQSNFQQSLIPAFRRSASFSLILKWPEQPRGFLMAQDAPCNRD
jgi:hypothetical protein